MGKGKKEEMRMGHETCRCISYTFNMYHLHTFHTYLTYITQISHMVRQLYACIYICMQGEKWK